MIVEIRDDFSLEKIIESGQCFRPKALSNNEFLFISGKKFLKIKKLSFVSYDVSCTKKEWIDFWSQYFDLNRSYSAIRKKFRGINPYVDSAMDYSRGIRILRQDKWESLISFIISQRKSIPAIRKTIEYLVQHFGSTIPGTNFKAFPSPEELQNATEAELKESGLGYRAPYVRDALKRVLSKKNLNDFEKLDDEKIKAELKAFNGVGEKVANCVALFAFARTSLAPVDVWIQKAIDTHFNGVNIFPKFSSAAGIIQQYIFFFERNNARALNHTKNAKN